jgi:hypothetical protein
MTLQTIVANKLRTASFAVLTTCLIVACPALSLAAPTTIYAGTEGGILKSTNGGATWTNLTPTGGFPGTVNAIAIDPVNTQTIYVGAAGELYKATDGGTHWTAINNGIPGGLSIITSIAIDPTNTSIVYATSGDTLAGSLYKSTNGGASWKNLGANIPLPHGAALSVNYVAIDPTNHNTLYLTGSLGTPQAKSTDGGATWTTIATGFYQTIAIDPANPSTVYFSGPFGIDLTTNGGNTFTQYLTLGPQNQILIVDGLAIDPNHTSTVYAGAGNALYKSTATPPSFALLASIGTSANNIRALIVDPANSQTVYAATNQGVFVSTDAGSTWTGPVTPAGDQAAEAFAMEPNGAQGEVFQLTENAVTQLINEIGNSPFGAFSCALLQALNNQIALFVDWGVLSSAQGQALQAQIQPVLSAAPCK